MDSRYDLEYLQSEVGHQAIVGIHVEGIVEWVELLIQQNPRANKLNTYREHTWFKQLYILAKFLAFFILKKE